MDERVVLSVEDNNADFYAVEIALTKANTGIRVCRVPDGEQAIAFLQKSGRFYAVPRPHLVLLDINLPRKDGFEVLKYMKSDDSVRAIPVVMFTTSSSPGERTQALAAGAVEYVTKDSDLDQLIKDLNAVCARFLDMRVDDKSDSI